MRTAIKDTNVLLNMVITPGIRLIPSDMIILKEKIAGYNNTLTLATKEMKFGVNVEVKKVVPKVPNENSKITTTQKSNNPVPQTGSDETPTSVLPKTDETEGTVYLLGSAVTLGFLVARTLFKFHNLIGLLYHSSVFLNVFKHVFKFYQFSPIFLRFQTATS